MSAELQLGLVPSGFAPRPKDKISLKRRGVVSTNYNVISQYWPHEVFHYDIIFNPELKRNTVKTAWTEFCKRSPEKASCLAFDGAKNVFSRREISVHECKFDIVLPPRYSRPAPTHQEKRPCEEPPRGAKTVNVQLTLVGKIQMARLKAFLDGTGRLDEETLVCLQVLDVVVGTGPWLGGLKLGRRVFSMNDKQQKIVNTLVCRTGLAVAIRPCQVGLTLNASLANTAFYAAEPLRDILRAFLHKERPNDPPIQRRSLEEVERLLQKLRVSVDYGTCKREYSIWQVINCSPGEKIFSMTVDDVVEEISVKDYYLKRHGIQLSNNYPLLDVGRADRPLYIPAEIARVCHEQKYPRQLSDEELRKFILITECRPQDMMKSIAEKVGYLFRSKEVARPVFDDFGIAINTDFVQVPGNYFSSPEIHFAKVTVQVSQNSSWTSANSQFLHCSKVGPGIGIFICTSLSDSDVNNVCEQFVGGVRRCGIDIGNRDLFVSHMHPEDVRSDPTDAIVRAYNRMLQNNKMPSDTILGMLVFVMERRDPFLYDGIKRACYKHLGIPSQCVLRQNVAPSRAARNPKTFYANLVLKINMKLQGDGINWRIKLNGCVEGHEFFAKEVMVVGVDVTHSAPGAHEGSVAAAVGTYDRCYMRYHTEIREQPPRTESIVELGEMVRSLLQQYAARRDKTYPHRMLIYRDGVSDSEYAMVRDVELGDVQRVLREMGLAIQVTFVVVSKRHNTRFFGPQHQTDNTGNLYAGFCVDEGITSAQNFDFYLQSQGAIKGTSRPSHYFVVHDDYGFSQAELIQITFNFCHMYSRCCRSVKVPAPVYYAHHVCFRAKHIRGEDFKLKGNLGKSMFYL